MRIRALISKTISNITVFTDKIMVFLFPNTCPFCGKVSEAGICGACRAKLPYVRNPYCMRCGKPIRREEEEYCYDCSRHSHYYESGRAVWQHVSVVQSINSNIIIDGYMAVHLPVRWYVHMAEQYVNGRSPSSSQYHSVKAEDGKEDIIRQKSWQKRLADLWTFR